MARLVRPRGVHGRGASPARAALHQPRRPGLRADQPARGRQGRAVRALLADAEVAPPPVPRRVRRAARGRRGRGARGRQGRQGRAAVRPGVLRVRRRLGRAARRRAPRVRAGLAAARQGARMGPPGRVPRAVDPLHALRRPAGRALAADGAARDRGRHRRRGVRGVRSTRTFEAYGRMFEPLFDLFAERFPKDPDDSDFLYRSTITREDVRHAPGAAAGRRRVRTSACSRPARRTSRC